MKEKIYKYFENNPAAKSCYEILILKSWQKTQMELFLLALETLFSPEFVVGNVIWTYPLTASNLKRAVQREK